MMADRHTKLLTRRRLVFQRWYSYLHELIGDVLLRLGYQRHTIYSTLALLEPGGVMRRRGLERGG